MPRHTGQPGRVPKTQRCLHSEFVFECSDFNCATSNLLGILCPHCCSGDAQCRHTCPLAREEHQNDHVCHRRSEEDSRNVCMGKKRTVENRYVVMSCTYAYAGETHTHTPVHNTSYVCIYACVSVYMHLYLHSCVCVHVNDVCVIFYVKMYTYISLCKSTCICKCTCIYVYM